MKYLNNNLFTEKFLKEDLREIHDFDEDLTEKFEYLKSIYDREKFKKLSEAQIESEFISKVLENILDFFTINQATKKIQGKNYKPDFTLFESKEIKESHFEIEDRASILDILALCESKAYDIKLDSGKLDFKSNPHFQLMHYLTFLRIDYGFLTNGRFWRFYNVNENRSEKVFFEIDLESIILNEDIESFKYFYHIFKKDNFVSADKLIKRIEKLNNSTKLEIEDDLKSVIYGKDSIIELIAKEIYKNSDSKDLKEIFNNSIYFTFRLLFISYFESKFAQVVKSHKYYGDYSLDSIYHYLDGLQESKLNDFVGFRKLKELFNILNSGDDELEIPLFNGGLFDREKAKLLNQSKLLNNSILKEILYKLLYFKDGLFARDFKTLSVIHIGNIYEGLLDFELRIAKERLYYVCVNKEESYYDTYDFTNLKKLQKNIVVIDEIEKSELYLVNRSNSRKSTASYYTPKELSSFMVKSSIDLELEKNPDILNLKILDNACGSGHFLVESLNYITQKTFDKIEKYFRLKAEDREKFQTYQKKYPKLESLIELIDEEKGKIEQNLMGFDSVLESDEFSILKRVLLKRVIYGVDLNPFAIELTRLSLWIDTFIFGTPLSFIEHHIKVGNSLIGSSIEDLNSYMKNRESNLTLFNSSFQEEYKELTLIYHELDNLKDTTKEEILESKERYFRDIEPKLKKLNKALDFLTYLKFIELEKDKVKLKELNSIDFDIERDIFNAKDSKLLEDIKLYIDRYKFFNYNIEFPEVNSGFDIIIGNPPWDKTKFDDKDFFSQFRSNYRTMKNSEKAEVKEEFLSDNEILKEYESEREYIKATNDYYKKSYPLNAGSGDGNLFRFFIEKNLKLLAENRNLTYLFPATFISEDGSVNLREFIFNNFKMNYFYGFENREKIFKAVDSRFKFAIMQLENRKVNNQIIKTRFMQRKADILNSGDSILEYDLETIKALSPEHYALLELQNPTDLEIIKKAYLTFKQIDSNYIDFRRELDMTNDKDLFKSEFEENFIPLYEGKMIHQFNSKFQNPNYFLDLNEFDERLESKEVSRIGKDIGLSKKKLLKVVSEKELIESVIFDREFFKLSFRDIARNTDERSVISSIVGRNIGFGNTLFVNIPKKYFLKNSKIDIEVLSYSKILFINSIFNSIIFDFLARFFINSHFNKSVLSKLPTPQPSEKELKENPIYQQLIRNALLLTLSYNYDEFEELAVEFDIESKEIPKRDKERDMLKIESDCIVAKLYKIDFDELEHICKSFKVLNRNNPAYLETLKEFYRDFEIE